MAARKKVPRDRAILVKIYKLEEVNMANFKKIAAAAAACILAATFTFGVAACKTDTTDTPPSPPGPETPGEDDQTELPVSKEDVYTLNQAFAASPNTWNPHAWESNTDSIILGYITIGFYDVQLVYDENGDPTGEYEWVTEMASAFPVDVTSQYVGRYGVNSGDTRKAWEISLNELACWDDGTPITADDYIYSMQQQLDPAMLNRRADSYTSGTFTIYGASKYLYSQTEATYETVGSQGYATNAAAIAAGETLYIDMWNFYGLSGMVDADGNECPQWVAITDTVKYRDLAVEEGADGDWVSAADIWASYGSMLEVGSSYESYVSLLVENEDVGYGWDYNANGNGGVGLIKTDDYKIVIILQDSIDDFNLKYNLSSTWLVKKSLYDSCKTTTESGLVSSTYCTSLETTASYGPYKLTSFNRDSDFKLSYNPYWYGYVDGKHEGQFQTTSLYYRMISGESSHDTSMMYFMQGNLDDVSVLSTEMQYYGSSQYLTQTPESYTYQFFLCNNKQWLESEDTATENHSVLQLESFRRALSYSISRSEYCSAYSPASQPGFGLLNYCYVVDPETGLLYRDTEQAKRVSLLYNGFTENADGSWTTRNGTKFDDLESAYEAISGYDPTYAAELFREAYAEAVQLGLYNDNQDVVIYYGNPGELSTVLSAMLEWFNKSFAECLPEGTFKSVSIKAYTGYGSEDAYWQALKAGQMDLSFSAWGGAAMDPWSIIYGSYIDPANSNNYGFDSLSKTLDITLDYNGKQVTASLYDWASWLNNGQADSAYDENNLYTILGTSVGEADLEFKIDVLAACELKQLETAVNIPIYYSYTNGLQSAKYNNGTDIYVNELIGYGGIRHITFNYTNSEWTQFVSQNSVNGSLENYYRTH